MEEEQDARRVIYRWEDKTERDIVLKLDGPIARLSLPVIIVPQSPHVKLYCRLRLSVVIVPESVARPIRARPTLALSARRASVPKKLLVLS